jgi:hypothetical protein
MTQIKDMAAVVPALLVTVVAVIGLAVLIGLSAWELPVSANG